MSHERKILVGAVAAVTLIVVLFLVWPRAAKRLAPQPRRARIAIEIEGTGVARTGRVEVASGTPFRLHAVLEAETRSGDTLYYTEAERLVVDGSEAAPESLRRWDRPQTIRVLWFTVEGSVPYLLLDEPGELERFRATEFLRLDWPRAWSVPGRLEAANGGAVLHQAREVPTFGTQRFHVRIELFEPDNELIPAERYASPDAARLGERLDRFPTAVVTLGGGAATASEFFGLTHLEPATSLEPEQRRRLDELTRDRIAYSGVPLLAELIRSSGRAPEEIRWRRVDPDAGPSWGEAVAPGDLLQVAARWVVLYRDAGVPGVLDRDDLCFDFSHGAVIRTVREVFTGGGELDLGPLSLQGG